MSDYSDPDDYPDFYAYGGDWWNPFDSPDDYDDYLFYDGYDDSYDDCDYDEDSESDSKDEDLAAYMKHLTSSEYSVLLSKNAVCALQINYKLFPFPFLLEKSCTEQTINSLS